MLGSFFAYTVSLSVLLTVVALPIIGAVADRSAHKRLLLAAFAYRGRSTSGSPGWPPSSSAVRSSRPETSLLPCCELQVVHTSDPPSVDGRLGRIEPALDRPSIGPPRR